RIVPTPLPYLMPIPPNPVDMRRGTAAMLTPPRPKRAIRVHEGPEHLNHERPEIDWFAERLPVVHRVRAEVSMQVAKHAAGELHRWERGDRLEFHVRPPLSPFPRNSLASTGWQPKPALRSLCIFVLTGEP